MGVVGMDDLVKARAALDATRDLLGTSSRAFDWAWSLVAAGETYELGLALTLAPGARPSAQLYFNPRRRTRAFRERVQTVLAGFSFDVDWLKAVDELVPPEAVSTVLGFDVDRAGPTSGTLYLEEIERLSGGQADSTLPALAAALGLSLGSEADRIGGPYIWAVDFGARGALRLKVYRSVAASAGPAVEEEVRRVTGARHDESSPGLDVLFGAGPCSGYMVQRAYGADGGVLRHKVYRCLPYESAATAGLATGALRRLDLLGLLERPARLLERLFDEGFGTTSIALAFAPGQSAFEYATVYQALLRGRRD